MAKPGPKPKPTKLKLLQGNPGHRPLPKNEPEPDVGDAPPDPPEYLTGLARDEWARMAPKLHRLGLLTEIDDAALAAYCQCFATWVDANKKVEKHGALIKAPSGYPTQSPYLSIANKAMIEMRKWMVEFGMTASSRTSVKAAKKDKAKKSGFAAL